MRGGPSRLTVSWGKALEVPGTAALNVTGQAQIERISGPAGRLWPAVPGQSRPSSDR